ncbi:MAG: DUF1684 domain-containing protein [Gammaproteobacteria bacterium]|nr:DUF1684 domain-containing protein [Gammaproteobacteria bacterium]
MVKKILTLAAMLSLLGCSQELPGPTAEEHKAEIKAWQAERNASIGSANGWLSLVGLCWLEPGLNQLGNGSGADCEVDYHKVPADLGSIDLSAQGALYFGPASRSVTDADGNPVERIGLADDRQRKPTVLHYGSLRFYLIERFGEIGVRMRDIESDAIQEFTGLDYFPIDLEWRKIATFEPYPEPQGVNIINILGMEEAMRSPGEIVFEHEGEEYRLLVIQQDESSPWFVMLADATSGRGSYGAGRYIYIDPPVQLPDQPPMTVIDFNKVYNPPCAFTALATCPLPPMQNRLPLAITAGEKEYKSENAWQGDTG